MDTDEKTESGSSSSTKSTTSDDGDIYEVEKIISISKTKGKTLYKVRWQGYDPSWDTWEPIDNLGACLNLVEDFLAKNKKKKPQPVKAILSPDKLDKDVFSQEDSSQDTIVRSRSPSQASNTSSSSKSSEKKRPTWKYVSSSDDEADTLKDKFWRDLDQGKVNVFENDMYSKVKGEGTRPSRPESFKEMYQNKPLIQSSSVAAPIKKKRNSSERKSVDSIKSTESNSSIDSKHSSSISEKGKKGHKVKVPKGKDTKTQHNKSVDSNKKTGAPLSSVKYLSDGTVDTLKDTFFRDLEEGKINVFEDDMYSKVKGGGGRAARPQSFSEMFQNKPLVQKDSSVSKGKNKRKSTEINEQTESKSVENVKVMKTSKKNGTVTLEIGTAYVKDSDVESTVSTVSEESTNSGIPKLKIQISHKAEDRNSSIESYASVDYDPPTLFSEVQIAEDSKSDIVIPVKDASLPLTVEAKAKKKKKKKVKDETPPAVTDPGKKDMVNVVGNCKNMALQAEGTNLLRCTVALTRLPHRITHKGSVVLNNGKLYPAESRTETVTSYLPNLQPVCSTVLSVPDNVTKGKLVVAKSVKKTASVSSKKPSSRKSMHGNLVASQGSVNNSSKGKVSGLLSSFPVNNDQVIVLNSTDEVDCISYNVSDQKQQFSADVTTKRQEIDKSKSTFIDIVQGQENRKRKLTAKETETSTSDLPKKGKLTPGKDTCKSSRKDISSVQHMPTLELEEFSVDFNSEENKSSSDTSDCPQIKKEEIHAAKSYGAVELFDISSHVEDVSSLGSPQHGPHSNYSVQSCDSGVDISHERSFSGDSKDVGFAEPELPVKMSTKNVADETQRDVAGSSIKVEDQGEKQLDFIEFDLAIEPSLQLHTRTPKSETFTELNSSEFRHAVKKNEFDKVQAAISRKKYDLEQPDTNGVSLLMICALHGFDGMLELLVRNGANINAETKSGVTALMMACEQGLRCTVELLLALGAFMNRTTANSGETALVKSIKRGHVHIVKSLLNYGCNFNSTSSNEHGALKYATTYNKHEIKEVIEAHIERVTIEFGSQVKLTLNNTAKIQSALFPLQCLSLRESEKFRITFKHELQPTKQGIGMLLFIAHARIGGNEAKCRFYGPCAVTSAILNGTKLHPLTEEGNFVMSFCPLHNGRNDLEIHTVAAPSSRAKLIVSAYQAQLIV